MTDLNKKEQIIGILSYICCAVILTAQNLHAFSLVYFCAMASVLFFADKIFEKDIIKNKTLTAFFIVICGYTATFKIFDSEHINHKQLFSAIAVAIFFACLFAMTDLQKIPYCIISAPILCLLDIRIASCYATLLLCWSLVTLQLGKYQKKDFNKKEKNKFSAIETISISAVVGFVCLGVCIYLMFRTGSFTKQSFGYFMETSKNTAALIIISIYLARYLFSSNFNAKAYVVISLVLLTAVTTLTTLFFGWVTFALFCLCVPLFLSLFCIQESTIIESIKTDYEKNKFIFWVIIFCAIQ